jgi:hypothetical protein
VSYDTILWPSVLNLGILTPISTRSRDIIIGHLLLPPKINIGFCASFHQSEERGPQFSLQQEITYFE